FSTYGLFRKTLAADALGGLAIESFILVPFAAGYLLWMQSQQALAFAHWDRVTDLLLVAACIVTVFPLYCFAQAARRLRLTTIGFLQYLSPTIQMLLAVMAFGEEFPSDKLLGFTPIWLALAIYSTDAVLAYRRAGRSA